MRTILPIALLVAALAAPALAQQAAPAQDREKPVDHGPNTPEANRAYNGGGVVLQGAPGAPAPSPQALPPGGAPPGTAVPR